MIFVPSNVGYQVHVEETARTSARVTAEKLGNKKKTEADRAETTRYHIWTMIL